MKYYAAINQTGGCDYTIKCGFDLVEIKNAIDIEHAEKLFKEMIFHEDNSYYDERALSSAKIISVVAEKNVDIKAIYHQRFCDQELKSKEIIDLNEYEEYQRLKEKFGE